MINPDVCDIEITQDIANALSLTSIQTAVADVRELAKCAGKYDAIWSISVVEHIAGSTTDSEAVKLMFDALRPGGRLIVTVPVDKTFWAEYRTLNHYGTQSATATGKYFFQHFYDEAAIRERLIAPLGVQPSHMEWYGETTHGRFHTYIQEWLHHGSGFAAGAAREEVDHYRVFPNWDVMPGAGVCGFVIKKPHTP